jgi:hypothetical protein
MTNENVPKFFLFIVFVLSMLNLNRKVCCRAYRLSDRLGDWVHYSANIGIDLPPCRDLGAIDGMHSMADVHFPPLE